MNGAEHCVLYCWYCNCLLTKKTLTVDHVIPVSRGGVDRPRNLVAACKWCNTSKSNKTIPEWRLRNVLAKIHTLRDQIFPKSQFGTLIQGEKPGLWQYVMFNGDSFPVKNWWPHLGGLDSEYMAFDRPLIGYPSYVDLPRLTQQALRRLTRQYRPAPEHFCAACGFHH
jgi:hypothetical protein